MSNCTCLAKCATRFAKKSLEIAVAVFLTIAAFSVGAATSYAQTYADLHDFTTAEMGTNVLTYPLLLAQGRDGNLYGTATGGCGMAFKITPSGTFTPIYTFNLTGADGCGPTSGLTLGTDGNFYGTTWYGAKGFGTLFKITPAGVLTTLYSFDGTQSQQNPLAPPVQGKNGTFYGITAYGAAYSITSSGKYKLLNPSVMGGSGIEVPLLLASDGNLYGVSIFGGTNNKGTVFRMSASGAVKIVYSFDVTHGSTPRGALVQGADGLLYGMTQGGGANAYGVVFKMTLTGNITVLYDINPLNPYEGIGVTPGMVAASDGKLYGLTTSGGTFGVGTLFQITKTGTFTRLYNFDNTHGGTLYATGMQHTNGTLFGLTSAGGPSNRGVIYTFGNSLPRFVALMTMSGTAGQIVQILGTGLTGTTSVKFGSGAAGFNVVSDTYMTATVPANGTSGYVTVVTPSGTLTSNKQYKITPVISGFSPSSGPVGTVVTISGSGFIGTKQVTFGGVKAISYAVDPSGTSITATVPVGAKTGKIALKTAGGNASTKTAFTVL